MNSLEALIWMRSTIKSFDDFTMEDDENPALPKKQINQTLKYDGDNLTEKFNFNIFKTEALRHNWNSRGWLNDGIIIFFLELINERSKKNLNFPRAYSMNTFFLHRMEIEGYNAQGDDGH